MHVDFKITTWERCELTDNLTPEEVKEIERKIKEGVITNYDDLEEEVGNIPDHEIILEAEEYMTPEENGGCSTVEFWNDEGEQSAMNTNE